MTVAADRRSRPEPFRIERSMYDGVPVVAVVGQVDISWTKPLPSPGELHIACHPAGPVSRLITVTRTATALRLHDTRDDALAAARGG